MELPGTPNFHPNPQSQPQNDRFDNIMARSNYIQPADDAFAGQMQTFKSGIGGYAGTLNVSPTAVTAQAADADYLSYVLASQQIMQNGARQWTGWKDLARRGGDLPPSAAPVPPVFPAAVPAVAPGIEGRFRALVKQIKAQASYNEAIGQALGIEGAQQTGPDFATLQPTSPPPSTAPALMSAGIGAVSQTSSTRSNSRSTAAKVSSPSPSTPLPATSTPSPSPPRQ
jgi:hypothetical protein